MSEKSDAREARAEAKEQAKVEAVEAADAAEAASAVEAADAAKADAKPTENPFAIPQLRDEANPKDEPDLPVEELPVKPTASKPTASKPTATKPARQTIIPGLYEKTSDHSFVHVSVVDGGDEVMIRESSGERKGIERLSAEEFLKPGVYARVIN